MKSNRLQRILGREDAECADPIVEETPLEPEQLVEATEAEDEMAEAFDDAEDDAAGIEEAEEVQEQADDQAEEQTEKIESGEPITPVEAAVATEQLRALVEFAGLNGRRSVSDHVIAKEDYGTIETGPATAYKISTEGFKEVAKAMVDTIKKLFASLMLKIKDLMSKILVAFNTDVKAVTGLLEKANKMTFAADATWSEDESKKWAKQFPVLAILGGGTVDAGASHVKAYLGAATSGYVFKAIGKATGDVATGNMSSAASALEKIADPTVKAVSEYLTKNPGAIDQELTGAYLPITFNGMTLSGLLLGDNPDAPAGNATKVTFKTETVEAFKVVFPNKAGVIAILTEAKAVIGKTKAFADEIRKVGEGIVSDNAKVAASVVEGDKEKAAASKAASKLANTYATGVAVQSINGLVYANRNLISYASAALKKAGGEPAKTEPAAGAGEAPKA